MYFNIKKIIINLIEMIVELNKKINIKIINYKIK